MIAPWTALKDLAVSRRKTEEAYLARAMEEFRFGQIRPGLMTKAALRSGGDKAHATTVYLQMLAKAIRDDDYIRRRQQASEAPSQGARPDQSQPIRGEMPDFLPYMEHLSPWKIAVSAIASLLVPGMGQFARGRPMAGALHLALALGLWLISLGWIMHLWSPIDTLWFPEGKR